MTGNLGCLPTLHAGIDGAVTGAYMEEVGETYGCSYMGCQALTAVHLRGLRRAERALHAQIRNGR